ncbi:MAG: hypothetical protein ACI865_000150 [Flavobacteriaceae bacterium]|jgi:hypothetical protein
MKNLYIFITSIILTSSVFAQAPEKLSYQAVIRNTSNVLLANQTVGMKLSILQGSITGTPVFEETQSTTSNTNGLVSVEIGTGTVISGAFNSIDWSTGSYYIKTETDPTGGTSYTITGTSQLLSVPYALHAKTADSIVGGIIITETDPFFNTSIASGISAIDTANWNNHAIDTDTQLDSLDIAALGFVAGAPTTTATTIAYKKLYMSAPNNYMVNLSWIEIYTNGTIGELVVAVPASASASARVSYAIDNGTPVTAIVAAGSTITIAGLYASGLELSCAEYSNAGPGGVLTWTGLGMVNGWVNGHVMYE